MLLFCVTTVLLLAHIQSAPIGQSGVQEIYVLAEQDPLPSVVASCVIYHGISSSIIKWHHNNQDITIDNQKYQLLSNTRLRINGITEADEGLYSCSYIRSEVRHYENLMRIFVLGVAKFASEEKHTLDVFQGESVDLDTRIIFTGAGASNNNQTVALLQLFKLDSVDKTMQTLVYFCGNEGFRRDVPCPSNDKVTTTEGSHKFDLILTLTNASMNHDGEYIARVEVIQPGVSSRSYITKSFVIRVHEPINLLVKQGKNSIQCEASISGVDQSTLSLVWTNSEGLPLSSNTDFHLTMVTSEDKVSLTAAFDVLTKGQYFCTASLSLHEGSNISETVNITLSGEGKEYSNTFQIAAGRVSSIECSLWYDRNKSSKMEEIIRDGIAIAVSKQCNCTVQASDFSIGKLHCVGEWLYVESSAQDAQRKEVLLTAIDEWTSSTLPTIPVGVFSLQVNTLHSGRIA